MRTIKYIVMHCTATPRNAKIENIQKYWRENLKWKKPGYHYIIKPSGEVVNLLSIEDVANGVAGFNSVSIHISYIGGVGANGKVLDNRTDAQKRSQFELVEKLKSQFPTAKVQGHRDFPGVTKECPSFDVASWLKNEYEKI